MTVELLRTKANGDTIHKVCVACPPFLLYPFGEPILRIGEKLPILKAFLASSFEGEGRRPCGGGSLECG